jgi:5' nucleotidase, deoxy (Pyrimidine), cytosolic type C protein (NT5C)
MCINSIPTLASNTNKKIIALDADGVLLDYNLAYASAWQRAFGEYPSEKEPNAYWAIDRWDVARLDGEGLDKFKLCFDDSFWSTIPAISGALEACQSLDAAGFELVCVTALPTKYAWARQENLRHLGFPIQKVYTADIHFTDRSPKADLLNRLKPAAFVDDYLPFLLGVDSGIHSALIHRRAIKSPNVSKSINVAASQHDDLLAFSRFWLAEISVSEQS